MQALGAIFEWIGANEAVLSGIAAAIVILGVLHAPIRRMIAARGRSSAAEPGAGEPSAAAAAAVAAEGSAVPALVTDRPSIAVLPFANLSGDAEQEFLADGLTEDIILGLSRVRQLFVIARNSCFSYKGRAVDARLVSRELGVRYVLEGSVRRGGERIRVTAQLVDATTGAPVWAEQFDRPVEQILELDDEVTEAIVAALQPALRRAEAEHARRAAPEDLTAWALVNRAWVRVQSDLGDTDAAEEAIRACEAALSRDPDYAFGHAVLAHARSLLFHQPEPRDTVAQAETSIRRALELDPDDPLVHHCHGALLGNLGRTREAVGAWQRAVALDPNNAGARAGLGISRLFLGETEEALRCIEEALRRSPRDPLVYHWLGNRALALALAGRLAEAEVSAQESLQRRPSRLAWAALAVALAEQGRSAEAGEAWRALREMHPSLSAEDFARITSRLAPDAERGQRVSEALLAAAAAAQGAAPERT